MHFNTFKLFLPALFVSSGILATQTASPSGGTPDVTYPDGEAFVFCSNQDCTGTCEVTNTDNVAEGDGEAAPNDMGFLSIYWYNPDNDGLTLYTCVDYFDCDAVSIGPNTCYNLYENGTPTDFSWYWYLINGRG